MLVPTTDTRSGGAVRQPEPPPPPIPDAASATAGAPEAIERPAPVAAPVPRAPKTAHGGRLLSLDMLRGVAILLVLGRHMVAPVAGPAWLRVLPAAWTRIGWSGVDLFFVLSGFLVSGLIFAEYKRTGGLNVRRFVIRRGFKIWPPYFVYVGFVACWLAWKHWHRGDPGVWVQLWPNLFHVQNYFGTPRIHTWSLAVEEHFYLAAALLFWWLLGRKRTERDLGVAEAPRQAGALRPAGRTEARWTNPGDTTPSSRLGHGNNALSAPVGLAPREREPGAALRHFPWFVAATVAALAGLRTYVYLREGPDGMNLYATHLRFDGLLIGTLLAYLTHFRPKSLAPLARHPYAAICAGLALAAPTLWLAPEYSRWTAGLGLTGIYVGYALVLVGWLNLEAASPLGRRLFRTRAAAGLGGIGFFSYSIYLWHIDLAQTPLHKVTLWASAHGWNPGVIYFSVTGVYVCVAIVAGRAMARLLERPSIALRDRLFPSGIQALPVAKD